MKGTKRKKKKKRARAPEARPFIFFTALHSTLAAISRQSEKHRSPKHPVAR